MPSLAEMALDSLGGDDVGDGIGLAASLFELALGDRPGPDRPEAVEPPTARELARLRDRLVELVRSGAPAPLAGPAVFALGKLHDADLMPFFLDVMRDNLRRDAGVLYQSMIALDNLGVAVFAGRDSMSVFEVDENRALAAAFLRPTVAGDSA